MSQTTTSSCVELCQSKNFIKQEWLDNLGESLLLKRCRTGEITKQELHKFIKQHQLYSRHFTRYLSALLANVIDEKDRLELTHNLFDEMGLGDAGKIPHSMLYRDMMVNMDIAPDIKPLPSTLRLIDAMLQCCKSTNHLVGLGALCLGAEGVVPYIYSTIVEGLISIGESRENLQFFTLHIECDDDHAETMYDIIQREINKDKNAIIDLYYGADKLIQARIDFFNELVISELDQSYMQNTEIFQLPVDSDNVSNLIQMHA